MHGFAFEVKEVASFVERRVEASDRVLDKLSLRFRPSQRGGLVLAFLVVYVQDFLQQATLALLQHVVV